MIKLCKTCGQEKDKNLFADHPQSKDGKHYRCLSCQEIKKEERRIKHNKYIEIRYIENKEKISEYHRQRYIEKKDEINAREAIYRKNNKKRIHERYLERSEGIYKTRRGENYGPFNTRCCATCKVEKSLLDFCKSKYYASFGFDYSCKQCKNQKQRQKYAENPEEYNRKMLKYREENPERYKEYHKKYNNTEKGKETKKEHRSGINFRIGSAISSRIRTVLKEFRITKENRSVEYLGMDIESFKAYLESKFTPGMTWDNYGFGDDKWHIDHITPIRSFDLRIPEQRYICFNYTNLEPKWQPDNIRKNDKMPDGSRARDLMF